MSFQYRIVGQRHTLYASLKQTNILLEINTNAPQLELYRDILTYDSLSPQIQFIFSKIDELFEVFACKDKVLFNQNGKVTLIFQIKIGQKIIEKRLEIQLKQIFSRDDDQLSLTKKELQYYRKKVVGQMQKQIKGLKESVRTLNLKVNYLQKIIEDNIFNQKNQVRVEKQVQQKKQEMIAQKKVKIQENTQKNEQSKSFSVQFNELSPFYDKFTIQDRKIKSLCEDYYQVYSKQPLPNQGIYLIRAKYVSEVHCSIGILAQSQLKNQYSFQNKKCICFYSYTQGNFRGIYIQGSYTSLTWPIELNQIINIKINMNNKIISIWREGNLDKRHINFEQLAKNQRLHFLVQMYEKDNQIQFL